MPDTAQTRERILAHAARILAERGYDRARLRDVARSAEVSIGLVQHYFDTRDALLEEAFGWSIEQLLTRWRDEAGRDGDAWRRLLTLIDTLTGDADLDRRSTTWVEFCVSAARYPQLRRGVAQVYAAWRDLLRTLVADGSAHGAFDPALGPDRAADILSALVDGCDLATASRASALTPPAYRDLLVDAATALLRPAGPAEPR